LAERLIAEPELLHDAGPKVLPNDVRAVDQPPDNLGGLRLGEVQGYTSLVGVERHKGGRHPALGAFLAQLRAAHLVGAPRLDFDYVGAAQSELVAAERPGQVAGEVENANAGEGLFIAVSLRCGGFVADVLGDCLLPVEFLPTALDL
jgi:hypothetical protein